MLVYVKYECFVMQMMHVCVLCASCCSSQCSIVQKTSISIGCVREASLLKYIHYSQFKLFNEQFVVNESSLRFPNISKTVLKIHRFLRYNINMPMLRCYN